MRLSMELYDSLHAEAFNKAHLQKVEYFTPSKIDPPELAGALHHSKKIEEENTSRNFLRRYTQIQDEIFVTIRLFRDP